MEADGVGSWADGLRASVIRPQAILVFVVVLIVVLSGAPTVALDATIHPATPEPNEVAAATSLPAVTPATTPTPDVELARLEPTPTPTTEPAPTQTPVPQPTPTERPAPPARANASQAINIDQGTSG